MPNELKYRITKGLPWERLIMVKDKDSHRIVKPSDSWGLIKTGDVTRAELTTTITTEGGIVIALSEEETKDLPVGTLEFDVMAILPIRSIATGVVSNITTPVAKGTIIVTDVGTVTPLEEIDYMELRFSEGEDYYRTFTWRDSHGDIVSVQNAYMQAENSSGTTVLDLRWYSTPPSEVTIAGLAGNRRGYISPATGASLIVHVSNTNTIQSGSYNFDIFVQDSAGDWSRLTKGALVVESSVSVKP